MSAAERKRLERERKRRGDVVIPPLAVPAVTIETLIDGGWLRAWDADNPAAVAKAIEAMLGALTNVTA